MTGSMLETSSPSRLRGRKDTPVKDACERRKCQEFNRFGFSGRTAGKALVPFDDRPLTSNFSGRHSRVASCSSAEKHSCSSGGHYDIDPKAMPLLGWDERRGTAPLYQPMWRPTDHVPLCRLCTCFCSNKPSPPCPFQNAHCSRGASPCRPHRRGRAARGDATLWREQK